MRTDEVGPLAMIRMIAVAFANGLIAAVWVFWHTPIVPKRKR